MLTGIPLLHYFKCKNEYSGCHSGMRYLFTPGKKKVTAEDGTETEQSILTVTIWPDPWALDKTDPALRQVAVYPLNEEGRQAAIESLAVIYEAQRDVWDHCPGILDCEPWYPQPENTEEAAT